MKKFLRFSVCLVFVLAVCFTSGCKSPSGSSGSGGATVKASLGSSVDKAVVGSEVFIEGRTVEIYAKWICDHEVTQKEFKDVMGRNPSHEYNYGSGDSYPTYNVSWYEAIMYCNKRSLQEHLTPCYKIKMANNTSAYSTDPDDWGTIPNSSGDSRWNGVICDFMADGYRLLTEAEWEYAARGGTILSTDQYSGTNDISEVKKYAWYDFNSNGVSHEVKTRLPNALYLYDMTGNIDEWCWDWYDTITTSTPSTGGPETNMSQRVVRGGHFAYLVTVNHRSFGGSAGFNPCTGFRVCRSAQ